MERTNYETLIGDKHDLNKEILTKRNLKVLPKEKKLSK